MEITGVKIRKLYTDKTIRALVSVVFDNELAVHELKVIEGKERLFVAMPSRRELNGEFRDLVHPLSREVREKIEHIVLEEYFRSAIEESEKSEPENEPS